MEFIVSHWHCIVPAIGIAAALLFMRDKNKKKNDNAPENAPRVGSGEDYEETVQRIMQGGNES